MGRPSQSPAIITHFSHPHPLRLVISSYPPAAGEPLCYGCSLAAVATAPSPSFACYSCNFLLHLTCATLPPLLFHTSHPSHGLALLPRPPYPDLRYTCDACARPGAGFVYHCAACGLDLHARCATAPAAIACSAHADHVLALGFGSPYGDEKGFTCDVCAGDGVPREWLYRCAECEFDAHLACGSGVARADEPIVAMMAPRMAAAAGAGGGGFAESVAQGVAIGLMKGILGGGEGGGGGTDGGSGGGGAGGGDGGGPGLVAELSREIIGGIFR